MDNKPLIKLEDFKIVKNRIMPERCYKYVLKQKSRKYEIFTLDGGAIFYATVDEPRLDKKWYTEFRTTCLNVSEAIDYFNTL